MAAAILLQDLGGSSLLLLSYRFLRPFVIGRAIIMIVLFKFILVVALTRSYSNVSILVVVFPRIPRSSSNRHLKSASVQILRNCPF